ncbi:MAG: hypothetical protein ACP5VF_00440 [Acidobacteriota bacterium]
MIDDILRRFSPSLPPVAMLLDPPFLGALRVASNRKETTPLVRHEEVVTSPEEGYLPAAEELEAKVSGLLARLGQPKRISAVLGDSFFRMQVMSLGEFPRQEEERRQVIFWNLRKSLNVPVESLRMSYEVIRRTPGSTTLWVALCPEEPARLLEAAFQRGGCQLGHLGASSVELFNLARSRDVVTDQGNALLIHRTPAYLSFLFTEGGRPLFFRCKETDAAGDGAEEGRLQQEVRLTLAYYKDKLGGGPLEKVLVHRYPEGVDLPLEELEAEGTRIETMVSALPPLRSGALREPQWMPLYALLERN